MAAGLLAAGASLAWGTPPASAAEVPVPGSPPANAVTSSIGTAFELSLPSFTLASGSAATYALRDGRLSATGAGLLAPSPQGVATATSSPGHHKSDPAACASPTPPAFPAPFAGLVTLTVACGSATADASSKTKGTAAAGGQAGNLSLNLSPLLQQLVKPADPIVKTLGGLLGKLPPLPVSGKTLASLLGNHPTVTATIGTSSAAAAVSPNGWSSVASANGSTIRILPGVGSHGNPLVTILVGTAEAKASIGRGAGKPSASDTPALVTVEVDAPGAPAKTFSVVPGQSVTVLKGTPLESTIAVAAGSVTTNPNGSQTATAHGVEVDLAQGLSGGLGLALARATASAAAPPAAAIPPPKVVPPVGKSAPIPKAAPSIPNATVPHTGLPWAGAVPVLAAGAAAGAALVWWPRRRRSSQA